MKTIILCGGIGYRLKEETEFKPKPMVHIGNKPILWHIMKIYAHYGYNDFLLALGYRGDYIKDYFLNQKHFAHDFTLYTKSGYSKIHGDDQSGRVSDDFRITFVDTGQETLPGERILRLKKYIPKKDKYFMVTYGDGVADINIKKLVKFHQKKSVVGTITGVNPRSKYGIVRVDSNSNSIIKGFIEKPQLENYVNGGFMVFKKEFFNYLKPKEYEHPALKRLIREKQLALYPHNGFWHCMDTYPDVDNLNKLWEEDPKWKIWQD